MSNAPLPPKGQVTYNGPMERTEPDWIKEELDKTQHLNSLRGDEYEAEAKRQGFVITDKGLYADPNHPARRHRSIEESTALLEALARRHGHDLDLTIEAEASGPDAAAS